MRRVALPLLPVGAVFADVVQQPRPMAVLLRAKCRRKFSRQRRDVLLVLPQRLICSVRLQVRDIIHFLSPSLCRQRPSPLLPIQRHAVRRLVKLHHVAHVRHVQPLRGHTPPAPFFVCLIHSIVAHLFDISNITV